MDLIVCVEALTVLNWFRTVQWRAFVNMCGGYPLTINTRCRRYALLLTRSVNTQLALCGAPWCYWSVVDCDGRATVVEVGWRRCCLGVLLFTGARSMGRAVQWSPMEPVSWSGSFPLKHSPTCLQNVPREHAKCTAGTYVPTGPSHVGYWLNWTLVSWCFDRRSVGLSVLVSGTPLAPMTRFYFFHFIFPENCFELRRVLNWLQADPNENTARNNTCCDCWLPWKSCLSGCCLDTDLRKRYLVTGIPNMWDVSMGGSHT
jgi:hypothetical protein